MDRGRGGPVLIVSSEGGMNIEEVAEKTPDKIKTIFLGFSIEDKLKILNNSFKSIGMDDNSQIKPSLSLGNSSNVSWNRIVRSWR